MQRSESSGESNGSTKTRNHSSKQTFINMLESMGVDEYDPSVLVALEEYGRRLATDLLCDAKDFATHASRTNIDSEDIKMAVKVKDTKTIIPSTQIKAQQDAQINSEKLPLFPEDNITVDPNKLPILQTRPYTYVPGMEAYAQPSDTTPLSPSMVNTGGSRSSGGESKKQQIPIVLHPDKRGSSDSSGNKKQRVLV